jgi:hypothetical protein
MSVSNLGDEAGIASRDQLSWDAGKLWIGLTESGERGDVRPGRPGAVDAEPGLHYDLAVSARRLSANWERAREAVGDADRATGRRGR